jgi:hypothetical protein
MAEWDTDGFDDPFAVSSADVFGRDVGDVDVWKANDSFDGGEEWLAFNGSDDDDDMQMPPAAAAAAATKSKGKKTKSSTTGNVKEDKEKRRSKTKSSSGSSSSSRERSERSKQKHSSSSPSPSKSKREKTTKPSSSSLRGYLDTDTADKEGVSGHESSSVSTPTSEEFQGRIRHNRIPMSSRGPVSPRAVVYAKQKSMSRLPSSSSSGISNHLALNAGSSSSNHHRSSRAHSPATNRDWNLEGAPRTPNRPRRAVSDDALASSFRTTTSSDHRRVSSSRKDLVRKKDGSVQHRRPGERARRAEESNDRRESVKSSLFKLNLEDEDTPSAPSDTPPSSSRRGRGPSLQGFVRQDSVGSLGSTGVQSAPPRIGASPLPPSSRDVKSRRWNKKMLPPASPRKEVTALGVQIAQEGYIEVVDGKMRLVFDVPTNGSS